MVRPGNVTARSQLLRLRLRFGHMVFLDELSHLFFDLVAFQQLCMIFKNISFSNDILGRMSENAHDNNVP